MKFYHNVSDFHWEFSQPAATAKTAAVVLMIPLYQAITSTTCQNLTLLDRNLLPSYIRKLAAESRNVFKKAVIEWQRGEGGGVLGPSPRSVCVLLMSIAMITYIILFS